MRTHKKEKQGTATESMGKDYIPETFCDTQTRTNKSDNTEELEGPKILREKLKKAIKNIKNGKVPEPGGLNVEIPGMDEINRKKPSAKICNEYHVISLIRNGLKIFPRILHARIRKKNGETICEKFGFRNGFGMREALFVIEVLAHKCLDQRKGVYLYLLDSEVNA